MEVTLTFTTVVRRGIGPRGTVVALMPSGVERTLQAAPVVLQKDSYGWTRATLPADSYRCGGELASKGGPGGGPILTQQ